MEGKAGSLAGKVVLVTGATSGIGRAAAIEAARQGAKVVVSGRREEKGKEVVEKIHSEGGEATWVSCDVTQEDQIINLIDKVVQTYGRLDCAFNNAGCISPDVAASVSDTTMKAYEVVTSVNQTSILLCMKYQITQMKKQDYFQGKERSGRGSIVNCSSISAEKGGAMLGIYSASKAAINALSRAAAIEVAKDGIRINSVVPGIIDTDIWNWDTGVRKGKDAMNYAGSVTPMARCGDPEEVAKPVVFLLSDAASYITGTQLAVDGGFLVM